MLGREYKWPRIVSDAGLLVFFDSTTCSISCCLNIQHISFCDFTFFSSNVYICNFTSDYIILNPTFIDCCETSDSSN